MNITIVLVALWAGWEAITCINTSSFSNKSYLSCTCTNEYFVCLSSHAGLIYMVQLNLNFIHVCTHRFKMCKALKLLCACTVAGNFGKRMQANEHTRHTCISRDACHKLATLLVWYS